MRASFVPGSACDALTVPSPTGGWRESLGCSGPRSGRNVGAGGVRPPHGLSAMRNDVAVRGFRWVTRRATITTVRSAAPPTAATPNGTRPAGPACRGTAAGRVRPPVVTWTACRGPAEAAAGATGVSVDITTSAATRNRRTLLTMPPRHGAGGGRGRGLGVACGELDGLERSYAQASPVDGELCPPSTRWRGTWLQGEWSCGQRHSRPWPSKPGNP